MASDKPICKNCGASGRDAEFSLFSKHGFGTYCVPCEKIVEAAFLEAHTK